jgi:DNA-binding SARP family transcriptional activator
VNVLLLGPVEFVADGRAVPLGRRRERLVLATLALQVGRAVPVDRLASIMWDGDEPPEGARGALKVSASRLRKVLGPYGVVIAVRGDAYVLDIDPSSVDAHQFRVSVGAALAMDDPKERAIALREALAMWRGDVMEDTARPEIRLSLAADLIELRLAALARCFEAEIDLGRHREAAAQLRSLVAERPTHEGFVGLLMMALVRDGRPAEALDVFAEAQRVIADELGADPGPDLLRLHVRILRQDTGPDDGIAGGKAVDEEVSSNGIADGSGRDGASGAKAGSQAATGATPIQTLPRDVPAFTGRDHELVELAATITAAGSAPVMVVTGQGGVGKTALAVHWGHRATHMFPDGQLFVNLHSYGAAQPLSATEALTHLLLALGEPVASIPPGVDGAAAMYRARLSRRRVLIVVDNASTADQVRPLLPGAPGCGVVVTSRDPLTGLTAGEGARRIVLRQLDLDHSVAVLRSVVGDGRIDADHDGATRLAVLCGGLPLALRVAAANLAGRPDMSVASYHQEVSSGSVLDALQVVGDLATGVRATLASSYVALSAPARRLFRLLGVPSGADVTTGACAALMAEPTVEVTPVLAELRRAHLVEAHADDRYALHDLVRAYAVELQSASPQAASEALAARKRLQGYYLHSADNVARLAYSDMLYFTHGEVPSGVEVESFDGAPRAMEWLDVEVANLVAEMAQAADDEPTMTVNLCDSLNGYFWRRRYAALWTAAINACDRATRELGDESKLAWLANMQGIMHWAYGAYEPAERAFLEVAAWARRTGNRHGVSGSLGNLGTVAREAGRLAEARVYLQQALDTMIELGDERGQAAMLISLSYLAGDLGDFSDAIDFGRRAEALYREAAGTLNKGGLAAALLAVADAYIDSGERHGEAGPLLDEARALSVEVGSVINEAWAWTFSSALALADGAFTDAYEFAERAHTMSAEMGNPDAQVYALLRRATAEQALGRNAVARRDFREVESQARQHGARRAAASALLGLAEMADADGSATEVRDLATEALAFADRPAHVAAARAMLARTQDKP